MKNQISIIRVHKLANRMRVAGTWVLIGAISALQVSPAYAAIDNTANAVGTYNATTNNYGSSAQSIPVTTAAPSLVIAKSVSTAPTIAAGLDATLSDANDTITYQYVVTNNGNVTLTNVLPTDVGPKFNGVAGTGTWGPFTPTVGTTPVTLAPGASKTYTAVYTMSQLDVDRSAGVTGNVTNTAGATGNPPTGPAYNVPAANQSSANTTVPAGPKLSITKVAVLTTDTNSNTKADKNDVITYTYTVKNVGNVAMTNVQVNDIHEGAALALGAGGITSETVTLANEGPLAPGILSTDGTANNGIWSTLQPGSTVTFTYVHTVTQTEVDNG